MATMGLPAPGRTGATLASSRERRQSAFRVAARHSRRVRRLRVVIPVFVALASSAMLLVAVIDPFRSIAGLPIDIGRVVLSGSKVRMEAPRLSGYTRDRRSYELSAEAAAQDLTRPGIVELETIRAVLELADRNRVTIKAVAGLFDNDKQLLTLDRDIRVDATSGHSGRLTKAVVDIREGVVTSDEPVDFTLVDGHLVASRMEIRDNGTRMLFEGGVRLVLTPRPSDESSLPTSAAAGANP